MEGFADPHDGEVNLTIEMFVPSSQVGRIIGKGGTNVRELQRVTGAMIKLPEQLSPPPKDETSVVVIGKWIQVLVSIALLYVALDDDSKLVFFLSFCRRPNNVYVQWSHKPWQRQIPPPPLPGLRTNLQ